MGLVLRGHGGASGLRETGEGGVGRDKMQPEAEAPCRPHPRRGGRLGSV